MLLNRNHVILDDGECPTIYNQEGHPCFKVDYKVFHEVVEKLDLDSRMRPYGREYFIRVFY
jgi:hypothetical protein